MVNCVKWREDRWRIRPERCAQCGGALGPEQAAGLRNSPLLCEPCSRKAVTETAVSARRTDAQRRRAATTGNDNRETGNYFTSLFHRAEARPARAHTRAFSAHLLGMHRRVQTPTSASAAASASDFSRQEERGLVLFESTRTPRSPQTSRSASITVLNAPVPHAAPELAPGQRDLLPTRPRRHTTGMQHEAQQTALARRLSPRARLERANSQQFPVAGSRVDLSYLSEYK